MANTAIITGGSSGIGRATALRLAQDGYDIGITYNKGKDRALTVAGEIEKLGRRVVIQQQDLSRPDTAAAAIDALVGQLGSLDAFVNNAGINHRGAFLETPLTELIEVINVNLTGAFVAAQAAAKQMIARGSRGRIVNVTSILDREALGGGAAYCASKAALRQLTRVMALELAPHGIRVNGVAPGETATPMNFATDVDAASIVRPVTPVARPGYASEIAAAIAFLLSPDAQYVCGEVMLVDGGLALYGGPNSLQTAVGKPLS